MMISRLTRHSAKTRCRMCRDEIWEDFYLRNGPTRVGLVLEYQQQENDQHEANRDRLWRLEAKTASGSGLEIICTRHLQSLAININQAMHLRRTE